MIIKNDYRQNIIVNTLANGNIKISFVKPCRIFCKLKYKAYQNIVELSSTETTTIVEN